MDSSEVAKAEIYIKLLDDKLGGLYELNKNLSFKFGSTAYIFFYKQKSLDVVRVIKILKKDLATRPKFTELFNEEIKKLTELTHQNIIKILDSGYVTQDEIHIPYYIMEYLEEAQDLMEFLGDDTASLPRNKVLKIFHTILEGLEFMHSKSIYHMDIKERNILVDCNGNVKIADVGFAKKKIHGINGDTYVTTTYRTAHPELQRRITAEDPQNPEKYTRLERSTVPVPWVDIDGRYDLYSAGFLFDELLTRSAITNALTTSDVTYLRLLSGHMRSGYYKATSQTLADFNKIDAPTPTILNELSDYPKNMLRVPELISTSFTSRLRKLINHPFFTRLHKIKQLSSCYYVYPGAMHTRYEHSLGVYSNVCKYVNSLLCNSETFKFMMTEQDILALLVAGLCHDLGQYPYAHAFEDIDYDRFAHEKFTKQLLKDELQLEGFKDASSNFREILKEWSVDIQQILDIYDPQHSQDEKKNKILKAIIDGPVDADKLDYLTRDSIHTGVLYGRFLDRDRFLQSLTIDNNNALALTHKGRISAELFAFCRYAMFSEVYWHKTVRALHSMITSAIEKYVAESGDDEFVRLVFNNSDEYFMDSLCQSNNASIAKLANKIRARDIYKEMSVVRNDNADPAMKTIYENISEMKWANKQRYSEQMNELIKNMRSTFSLDEFENDHLIIDVPNPKKDRIGYINIISETTMFSDPISVVSPLWNDISKNFEAWVRRIRFYVDNKFADRINKQEFQGMVKNVFGR